MRRPNTEQRTHWSTLLTQSNLASALSNDKQYASAEPLLREMLVHQRRVSGKEDINTLITVSTLPPELREGTSAATVAGSPSRLRAAGDHQRHSCSCPPMGAI